MHGHGQGTRLGTCLVQLQCVSCVVASAACVIADKCSVLLLIIMTPGCAQAWTRHVPWYMPCAVAVCLVCCYFVACFNVSISWLGGGMHKACGLAHG